MTVTKKILCLPGYLQSGKIFAEKSSGLRKLLTKKLNLQLDYVNPPFVIKSKEDLPFTLAEEEEDADLKWKSIIDQNCNRCWWQHHDPNVYEGFDQSLEYLVGYIKENGPYDGIIGFSQGAAMSAVIINVISELIPNHKNFQIAVLFSGFAFTEPIDPSKDNKLNLNYQINDTNEYTSKVKLIDNYKRYYRSMDTTTRVLNVYGSKDMTVPGIRSQYLSTTFKDEMLTEYVHEGGHFIPNKKQFLTPIIEDFREVFDIKSNL
ncbi:uncharacterized protein AC631_03728 [Debaryomyces fabryi]|uniref:Serine hydrolase domain-containing protein n=1 Tax=Debaryomyces fabryi TaxID=58627 RepID=A0A0V1PW69_9ASCO|nr:uncharacterized protein AC631_03728 [Debaryomyces fabryi]KSA00497.1 hypothetical protein AC631_03728 [Debaryomyces fabryi]CUM45570.1 unnamed protein product [Debaryomyces fabryi]